MDVHDSTPSNLSQQSLMEGRDDEEMKSLSVRINPKYLRIHADRMHKDQPFFCTTSAEEAMYRRRQASVLQNRVYSFFENHGYFHGY